MFLQGGRRVISTCATVVVSYIYVNGKIVSKAGMNCAIVILRFSVESGVMFCDEVLTLKL